MTARTRTVYCSPAAGAVPADGVSVALVPLTALAAPRTAPAASSRSAWYPGAGAPLRPTGSQVATSVPASSVRTGLAGAGGSHTANSWLSHGLSAVLLTARISIAQLLPDASAAASKTDVPAVVTSATGRPSAMMRTS